MEQSNLRIVSLFQELRENHPDPEFRQRMAQDAEEWEHADEKKRNVIIYPLLRGLGMLVAAPFLIVGTVFHGTGQLLIGFSNILTTGSFKSKSKKNRRLVGLPVFLD